MHASHQLTTSKDGRYEDASRPCEEVEIVRWQDGKSHGALDALSVEEPLAIRVRGRPISITMRTPGHDRELAAGFLLTEGVIANGEDIIEIELCQREQAEGNILNVLLAPDVHVDFERLTRHVFASSSCGVCGKASIEAVESQFPPIGAEDSDGAACGAWVSTLVLSKLPDAMRAAQETFERTGGLHAAAIFDTDGRLRVLREDVGRHNAVDKVIGHCMLQGALRLERSLLVVSGRSSFEIMQKSLAARIPIVAAVSAPSSLAVDFARRSGQTLVGFLRGSRMNVYSHPHRIVGAGA